MIDLHILTRPSSNPEWLRQCIDSIPTDVCTLHVIEGVEGHIGKGRARGYSLGTHDLVGYVDHDDLVEPDWYRNALQLIRPEDNGVVPLERLMRESGEIYGEPRSFRNGHHGFVYRREALTPWLAEGDDWTFLFDKFLAEAMRPRLIDQVGYYWRVHQYQASANFQHHPDNARLQQRLREFASRL